MFTDLLCVIPANSKPAEVAELLKKHPEIKFVSLVGIDLAGNDTDEKIVNMFVRKTPNILKKFFGLALGETAGELIVKLVVIAVVVS